MLNISVSFSTYRPSSFKHCPICQQASKCLMQRIRGLHGDEDHGNPAKSAGFPRVWKVMLRGSCGDGNKGSKTPAGMEQNFAGFPRECSSI